jgi:fructose-bisphosphate aldolase class II
MEQYGSLLVNLAPEACKQAKVPVALHLDHEQDEERVKYAASLPFDSIMVDMSHHKLPDNLRITRELTDYCHARGIAVEAEAGRIERNGFTERYTYHPEIALEFVSTGIDFLAPSIGNVHGGHLEGPFNYEYHR